HLVSSCVHTCLCLLFSLSFINTVTSDVYTLSLHDALPILCMCVVVCRKKLNWNLTSCFMSIEDSVSVAAKCCQVFCVAYEVWSIDRKSTRLNSSHVSISYAVFCLKIQKHLNDQFPCHL